MNRNYKLKKTISMKKFISELGENFSKHMKTRLMELDFRCVLTRKEDSSKLDLKHVEHTKYDSEGNKNNTSVENPKEYVYAEFIVEEDGTLYFSDTYIKDPTVMQSNVIDEIYNSISNENIISREDCNAKKLDDSNIDFVVDSLLSACPDVSQKYLDVVKHMLSY